MIAKSRQREAAWILMDLQKAIRELREGRDAGISFARNRARKFLVRNGDYKGDTYTNTQAVDHIRSYL